MTIRLPEELEQYVQARVRSGEFASEEAAITEAVRLLQKRTESSPSPTPASSETSEQSSVQPIWKQILDSASAIPDEAFERLPVDGSEQLDHYLYGSPRRPKP